MKKTAPYGKPLQDLINKGMKPNNSVNLFVGRKAWVKGKAFSISYPDRTLILPAFECPSVYSWPVNDCDILIIDTGYCEMDYLNDLAFYLYEHGAKIVRCVLPDYEIISFAN